MRALGQVFVEFLLYLGQVFRLGLETFGSLRPARIRWRLVARQVALIGFGSQMVVFVTGAFVGAVFTAQMYYQFVKMGVETVVGAIVSIAMCRELAPVMVGLMVSGRVGAAIAAEIGTMKVTEQIDALRGMAVSPVDYLVVPRFLGMMVSMPLLITEAVVCGIFASYVAAVWLFQIPSSWFWAHLNSWTELADILVGVIKGFVFGMAIVLVACHKGLTTTNGAVGVGRSTTQSVVIASLFILVSNFFLTLLLTVFFPL